MKRAGDRERKWLRRNHPEGRFKRRLEYKAAKSKRCRGRALADGPAPALAIFGRTFSVGRRFRAKLQGFSGGEPP